MPKSPSDVWWDQAVEKLAKSDFLDKVMLSFEDEAQYNQFNQQHRGQYTILQTLNNPTNNRMHVWVEKNKAATWVTNHNKQQRSHSVRVTKV